MQIVVSGGLVTGATVVLAFVLNQAYSAIGSLLNEATGGKIGWGPLGANAKKAVVAGTALGLAGYSALALLPAGAPPEELLAYAALVFAAAKPVYDAIWKTLLNAE